MKRQKQRIRHFLKLNGYTKDRSEDNSDYELFIKKDHLAIQLGDTEIVLLDDSGDWAHLNLSYYELVGFFYVHRINFTLGGKE